MPTCRAKLRRAKCAWTSGECRYTGVGAKDMLAQSSLHLSRRIRVECDGVHLALPPDTEGILLLNIPSYMGGVDLWASGEPRPICLSLFLQHMLSLQHFDSADVAADKFLSCKILLFMDEIRGIAALAGRPAGGAALDEPQSLCDQRLELVAVYGR